MEETFKEEWLREISALGNFSIPREYNRKHFVNWEKRFEFDEGNLLSSDEDRFGKVYDVGRGLVAKVSRKGPFIRRGMIFNECCPNAGSPYFTEREFWIGKKLKEIEENSINPKGHVPRPEGLFLIYNKNLEEYRPAFVMEKINFEGEGLGYIVENGSEEHEKIKEMISDGLDFFSMNGVDVGTVDSRWLKNNLLSKDDGHIYHIDYMFWGLK